MLWLLPCVAAFANAVSPLAAPDLQLRTNGAVFAMARQSDGSVVIGGDFSLVGGVARRNLARLRPDGSLDPDWKPSTDGPVMSIAIDAFNAVYVGGAFDEVGGLPRQNLAKIQPNGQVHPLWKPKPNWTVMALTVDANGFVYAGGFFSQISEHPVRGLAKIAASTGEVSSGWNPCTGNNCDVFALLLQGSSLYVGGGFDHFGGHVRRNIAKLSLTTGVADPAWNPSVGDGAVFALASDGNGALYVGGVFDQIGGEFRSNLARISSGGAGAADPTWEAPPLNAVWTLAWDGNGRLYAGGGGMLGFYTPQPFLVRILGSSGALDAGWSAAPAGDIWSLLVDGDGVLAGGQFETVGAHRRVGLARLDAVGAVMPMPPLHAEHAGVVQAIVAQPDGGTIAGGRFDSVNGQPRRNLLRLRPDREVDVDWQAPPVGEVVALAASSSGAVFASDLQPSPQGLATYTVSMVATDGGKSNASLWSQPVSGPVVAMVTNDDGGLFIAGSFSEIGGEPRDRMALLSTEDGAVDPLWRPNLGGSANVLVVDKWGRVFVGGEFSWVDGHARSNLAKLLGAGTSGLPMPAWKPTASGAVRALQLSADHEHLFVGGDFDSVSGQPRAGLARLSARDSGDVDMQWNPSVNGDTVRALALGTDGSLYVGGRFEQVGGQSRQNLARVAGTGSGAVADWQVQTVNGSVNTLMTDAAGRLWAGGHFSRIGVHAREALVALPTGAPTPMPGSSLVFRAGFEAPSP